MCAEDSSYCSTIVTDIASIISVCALEAKKPKSLTSHPDKNSLSQMAYGILLNHFIIATLISVGSLF